MTEWWSSRYDTFFSRCFTMVFYGQPGQPSYSYWIVPGTINLEEI